MKLKKDVLPHKNLPFHSLKLPLPQPSRSVLSIPAEIDFEGQIEHEISLLADERSETSLHSIHKSIDILKA